MVTSQFPIPRNAILDRDLLATISSVTFALIIVTKEPSSNKV